MRQDAFAAPSAAPPAPAIGADVLLAALEASHVAVTVSDVGVPDGPLVYVNAAFETITGYRREEVLGRNCRFLQGAGTDPDAVEELRGAIAARRTCDVELLNYRRDGSAFWNSLHLAPLPASGGRATFYVGMQRDVTAERRAREAERRQDRMLALGRLAGGVAHEINNLLQPVLTLPALVAEALPPDAVEARGDLALVSESARDACRVVRRLLDFGRAPDGSAGPTPFADALGEALEAARAALPATVGIASRVDVGNAHTLLDKTEVKQVLLNLAGNAADAMGGCGALTVEARRTGDRLLWSVADTGPGVPQALRERIFDAFYSTRPTGRSMGLGLFIVREIVARAGGGVRIADTPGGGATLVVDLPLAAPPPDAGASPRSRKTERDSQTWHGSS